MILAITMARGGSKGVPHKHTRKLEGKPVLAWTLEAVKRSKYIDEYYVSTDDPEIARVAYDWQVDVLHRPPQYCQDTSPTLPGLQWSVEVVEQIYRIKAGYVIEVRATSPFKTTEDIDGIIERLMESGADSVIGVSPLEDHHPARAKWLDADGQIHDFIPEPAHGQRKLLEPKAYIRNGTVYAFRREAVMPPDGKLFGHEKSIGYVMPPERSVNIDDELDFALCELLAKRSNA